MKYSYALSSNKYLSQAEEFELRGVLAQYRDLRLRDTTMILIMLVCGLRSREVLNIKKADIDFGVMSLRVATIKNGNPREVPLTFDLCARLKELCAKESRETLFNISSQRFRFIWSQYTFGKGTHCLRHTAAKNVFSKAKESSRAIAIVQTLLGHASLATTAIYLQNIVALDDLRELVR